MPLSVTVKLPISIKIWPSIQKRLKLEINKIKNKTALEPTIVFMGIFDKIIVANKKAENIIYDIKSVKTNNSTK